MTGKERREQLLDVGRSLFAQKGFDATSVEEIAAKADVSKPVVYEHFGGKEGLYAVVVDREIECPARRHHRRPGQQRPPARPARAGRLRAARLRRDLQRRLPDPRPRLPRRAVDRLLRRPDQRRRQPGRAHLGQQFKRARLRPQARRRCTPRCSSAWSRSPASGGSTRASPRRPRSPRTWSTSRGTGCPASSPSPACAAPAPRLAGTRLEQLEPVAVRVVHVAAPVPREVVVPVDVDPGRERDVEPSRPGPRPAAPGAPCGPAGSRPRHRGAARAHRTGTTPRRGPPAPAAWPPRPCRAGLP